MSIRSTPAAARRAASAALTRPEDFDRYLLIDDTADDVTEILTLLQERGSRAVQVQS